jgi:hypothetical protein
MFISATTDLSALNLLYEEYVGLFDNIVDFRDILDIATVDGGYLVVNNYRFYGL